MVVTELVATTPKTIPELASDNVHTAAVPVIVIESVTASTQLVAPLVQPFERAAPAEVYAEITYPVTAEPPLLAGAVHERVTVFGVVEDEVAVTPVGAPGTVAVANEVVAAVLLPTALTA